MQRFKKGRMLHRFKYRRILKEKTQEMQDIQRFKKCRILQRLKRQDIAKIFLKRQDIAKIQERKDFEGKKATAKIQKR